MAIADLPMAFQEFKMDAKEWTACDRFLAMAREVAPQVEILGPRRTNSGDIKIMVRFPEGDTWEMTTALATAAAKIRRDTGVLLILD